MKYRIEYQNIYGGSSHITLEVKSNNPEFVKDCARYHLHRHMISFVDNSLTVWK